MEKYKCCFCGEVVEQSEAEMWGHIQLCHQRRFEAMQNLDTPAMVDECYQPEDAKYERKTILVTPAYLALLFDDLDKAHLTTQNGDRISCYHPIAVGRKKKSGRLVEVALIEEAKGVPEDETGYAFHVINDVDCSNCWRFQTDHLDVNEAMALFGDILKKLADGRL